MKNFTVDFLHSELNRVSDWIRFVDRKIAFLSIFYIAMIWYMTSLASFQTSSIWLKNLYYGLYAVNTLLILWGIYILFLWIFPKTNNCNTDESLFFYGKVWEMKYTDFSKAFWKLSVWEIKNQLVEQVHTNSSICSKKMNSVKLATKIIFTILALTLILRIIQHLN